MASVFTIPRCSENFPRRSRSRMNPPCPSVQGRWWPRCAASLSDPGLSQSSGQIHQNTMLKSHWNPKTSQKNHLKTIRNIPKASWAGTILKFRNMFESVWVMILPAAKPVSGKGFDTPPSLSFSWTQLPDENSSPPFNHLNPSAPCPSKMAGVACNPVSASCIPAVLRAVPAVFLWYTSSQCPSMGENTITCWILLVEIPTPKFIMSCLLWYFKCGTWWLQVT